MNHTTEPVHETLESLFVDISRNISENIEKGDYYELELDGLTLPPQQQTRNYLPYLYGASNYPVIDDINKIPCRISDIYHRLTS